MSLKPSSAREGTGQSPSMGRLRLSKTQKCQGQLPVEKNDWSAFCILVPSRTSHSQITRTRCTETRSSHTLDSSRCRLRFSFSFQYSVFVFGQEASLQLSWECQKHPCTKMAHFAFLFAKSGLPGRSNTCLRNLRPMRCTSARVWTSGRVSRDRIRDIICDRDSGSRLARGEIFGRCAGIGRYRSSKRYLRIVHDGFHCEFRNTILSKYDSRDIGSKPRVATDCR